MIQDTLEMAFSENYPMIIIFTVIIVAIRIAYLIVHKQKFVFYKEFFMLAFLLYSLLLFYVVTFQDVNYGTNNFVPFHEIFRYEFGSSYFIHNILGNILLFIPFGYFVSRIMTTRKPWATLIISLITAVTIECTQLMIGRTFDVDDIILNVLGCMLGYLVYLMIDVIESHLPPFCSSNMFKNIVVVVFVALLALLYYYSSLWGILR
ncbi:MAG: VanZ family protein [Bacilli bacterium]|nr:VanZ family protein [Bacilli bacterium]